MKRLILIAPAVLLLTGLGFVAWTVAGLPPVRLVWRYGFEYGPQPTGRTLTVEGVEFVEIGLGCTVAAHGPGGRCARTPWSAGPRPAMPAYPQSVGAN